MEEIVDILVPLGICVALPVLVVWIVSHTKTNADNRRAEVLIKAIESNNAVDANKLAEAMTDSKKKKKTPFEEQVSRLTSGCVCAFLGLALNIVCLVRYLSMGEMTFQEYMLLIGGCVLMAIGVALLIVYKIVSNRMKAMEASRNKECESLEEELG